MGIAVFNINEPFLPNGKVREYIQTKFTDSLERGAIYRGRCYISPTYYLDDLYNVLGTDDFGMVVSRKPPRNTAPPVLVNEYSNTTIVMRPDIVNKGRFAVDTGAWHEVCGLFKAAGGEAWLTLGNFETEANTDTVIIRPFTDPKSAEIFMAYYYVDDVSFEKISEPVFEHNDTSVCHLPVMLQAAPGFDRYEWSTGDMTRAVSIVAPGAYWVKVAHGCGEVYDTIRVNLQADAQLEIADTAVCAAAFPLPVQAPEGFLEYEWSTGAKGKYAVIAQPGRYEIAARSACGTRRDSFEVLAIADIPDFSIGDTANLCQNGESVPVRLSSDVPLPIYEWSTGEATPQITAVRPGIYGLSAHNACDEKTDEVVVTDCPLNIYVPNIFSPDGDGLNDRFTAYAQGVETLQLEVYDRWGSLVFREQGDVLEGWDGTLKGRPAPEGVYAYLLSFKRSFSHKEETRKGGLTLIRQ